MTELDIYKFLHDESKCKQMEWQFSDFTKKNLAVWIAPEYLREFTKLLGYSQFYDGGVECNLCYDGCVYISNFDEILEEHDIEPTNILPKIVE